MKRSRRPCYQRLDYRTLHSSGRKVVLSSSESETDNESDDLNKSSNQLLDPQLISSFEELSCEVASQSVNESVGEFVSETFEQDSVVALTSSTVVASPTQESAEVFTSEVEFTHSLSSPEGEVSRNLIQSYKSLLTDKTSFEVSESHLSLAVANEHSQYSQCLLPPEVSIHSGLEAFTSSGDSFLEASVTSLSEFATPLINSTLVFDFPQSDPNLILHTEPSHENPSCDLSSIHIADSQLLNNFSRVAYYVYGLTELIKPVLRSFYH